MNNEKLIRNLIRGTIQRAIQESVAAVLVIIAFSAMMADSEIGSLKYFSCLMIIVASGFITGVVCSFALSYSLLKDHPAEDCAFWREAFFNQSRLLRWVPLWYCSPLAVGACLFVAPLSMEEFVPFLKVFFLFAIIFFVIIWLNRRAANCLEESARSLV